jgi:hypothetical protein
MARRNPDDIPVVYSHLPVREMLGRMAKERSMRRVRGWARAAVNRMEELSRMQDSYRSPGYFDYEAWGQLLADDLGLPLPASATPETLARMRRKSRSRLARERRVAALVLPPADLRAMIEDPDPAVRSILTLRLEGDDVIWEVIRTHGKDPTYTRFISAGAEVPGWDEGILVWRLSDKAFKKIHAGRQWHDLESQVRDQIISRAVSQGITPILSAKDRDCNTFQLITQGISLEQTRPYVEKFYECWFGHGADPDDPEGDAEYEMYDSLDQMISGSLLAKWAAAAPKLWAGMSPGIDVLEKVPQWLYGRPARWARDVMAGIEEFHENLPWQEYGLGEYILDVGHHGEREQREPAERMDVACGSLIEPLYSIARQAGRSDRAAWAWATKLWSLDEFAEERIATCRQRARENWNLHKNSPPRAGALHELEREDPWQRHAWPQ